MDLIQYIKRRKRRVGVLIGRKMISGRIYIGWSLCKKGDRFTEKEAIERASDRILYVAIGGYNGSYKDNRLVSVPNSIRKEVEVFKERCIRYFKPDVIVASAA